ncbi:MAG: ATP-binding protein, partial [Gemmatimonadales bacterium]
EIATVAPGYRLDLPPGGTDVGRFLADVTAGTAARDAGDPAGARSHLLAALGWWRGDALADVPQPFARAEALRFDGLRLSVEEQVAELDVELGDSERAVERLRALTTAHPLREDLRATLIRALYVSGRQADALAEYAALRETLAEELGIDPSPAVQRLHQQVLEQDGALAVRPPTSASGAAESSAEHRERPASRVSLPSTDLLGELVGRERDVERVVAVLRSSATRMITLTGMGGAGKSRMALAVASAAADDFADGVAYVPLAPLTDARGVLPAIAHAVGVPEGPDQLGALIGLLRDRRRLLLLDNAEHLLEAWADVADLVAACPGLRVLVTSRTPLRVRGEAVIAIEPLDEDAAAELFAARAKAASPIAPVDAQDPAVRALVRRLAGIPLALELAAARSRLLTPGAMLRRFEDLLAAEGARDLPRRQRTMQSALDWSFELLSEADRACFTRLAVFSDGFCLDAAVAVLTDVVSTDEVFGVLDSLVEQSLVVAESEEGAELPRFRLLEPVAQYAGTRLDAVAERAARDAHLTFYRGLAERTEPSFRGPGTMAALAMVERENANFAAAIEWGVRSGQVDVAGWLCWWLWLYWWLRGTLHEGQRL